MRIYCGISFHGFGHIAQTAAILNRLLAQLDHSHSDKCELIVQSAAEKSLLQQWIHCTFEHIQLATDLGIPMHNAVEVDQEETYRQYLAQFNNRHQELNHYKALLQQAAPDVVITNVSYLLSRAAAELSIPCFHCCSLNWADLFYEYCKGKPHAEEIYNTLLDDYNSAEAFFRISPGMPMAKFQNLVIADPIFRIGEKKSLNDHYHKQQNHRFALVSMGGMPYNIPYQNWPHHDNITWIINEKCERADMLYLHEIPLTYIDLLASCDLVVTKPGYGTFVECAGNQIPLLYLPRGDWLEEPYLIEWMRSNGYCAALTKQQLISGEFVKEFNAALNHKNDLHVLEPKGIDQIANHLFAFLPHRMPQSN